ncbi:hypothetical protein DFR86_01230 [Acidianus sulfidivorans JP7]|uniref:Uncharacterized protein n=1 Tax=Acidianus sulfidivorans JP7 TaxID=619593 RepID=A0A2U9IJT4_9CREN|nr:hypothetical protein [Acidianus sulfidivorans]AWR96299.1 hypothetical protein DFR86_01230 [Acidianus sulfidivorans JP7]
MINKLSNLELIPIHGNEISILVDSHEYRKVFPKLALLDRVNLYINSDDFLKETLELAGALRESGVTVSINNLPASKEQKLINDKFSIKADMIEYDLELTWRLGSNVFLDGGNYIIGKDYPVSDPRTGIIGNLLNKNTAVIFIKMKENEGVGKVIGKYGGEKLLVRPNKWFSDLAIVYVKKSEDSFITTNVKELFCRPLGSTFIPVTEDELFKVLIKFNMRSSGFPQDCYKILDWIQ